MKVTIELAPNKQDFQVIEPDGTVAYEGPNPWGYILSGLTGRAAEVKANGQ